MTRPTDAPYPDEASGELAGFTLDELFEDAPCGYVVLDHHGAMARVNRTFAGWTGFAVGALEGRDFAEILSRSGRDCFDREVRPMLEAGERVEDVAIELLTADRERFPVQLGARSGADRESGEARGHRLTIVRSARRTGYERELLVAGKADRIARDRAEALGALSERLADLVTPREVETALVDALALAGLGEAVTLRRSAAPDITEATFTTDDDSGRSTAMVPLVSRAGTAFGVLEVRIMGPMTAELGAYVEAVAGLGARSLERNQRLAKLQQGLRGGDAVGLPSRRWWQEALHRAMEEARGPGGQLTLALVEIKNFERYGAQHGLVAADRLLMEVSNGWRSAGFDLYSRFGGEEFAALMPGVQLTEALHIGETLRRSKAARSDFWIGFAAWDGLESATSLIGRAEAELAADASQRSGGGLAPGRDVSDG